MAITFRIFKHNQNFPFFNGNYNFLGITLICIFRSFKDLSYCYHKYQIISLYIKCELQRTAILTFPGQCQDYHPDCPSFVMSGMCDEEAPFKDAFNVREVCMLSCGVCNRYVTVR